MNNLDITLFMNTRYKTYSLSTLENRTIPSIIDSFKPVQRKIIHVANESWKYGTEKDLKVFQLSGRTADRTLYHHSSSSMDNAIILMAQKFKNNLPLLEDIGTFGSLRSPEAGAPRYISTRLSSNFRKLYKDFDSLEYNYEEGNKVEPKFFLPIIPTVLINGSSGVAVGFSSNILNRNPLDVIAYCESIILGKKSRNKLVPYNPYFSGEVIQDINNNMRWIFRGKFTINNTTTITVTELPLSYSYEKYESILDKLVDEKIITSYDNKSKKNINYVIKFARNSKLGLAKDDEVIFNILKLEESMTELFNVMNENNKLLELSSAFDVCEYFVKFRLKYYDSRKAHIISNIERDIVILNNKYKFLLNIINGKIKVNNRKREDLNKDLEKMDFDKVDGSFNYLTSLAIHSLTKEKMEEYKNSIPDKQKELSTIKKIKPSDMYLDDLKELRKVL